MNWIISANGKKYDHAAAFQKWGQIDWKQRVNYQIGDTVYIYCTSPLSRIMFKTVVIEEGKVSTEIIDDKEFWHIEEEYEKALGGKYARLKLVEQVDSQMLSLDKLKMHGLKAAPQGPMKANEELTNYIEKYMSDYNVEGIFPESDIPKETYEGACVQTVVNKYERSSVARQKCIEYKGTTCSICGFDFEKVYGEIGHGFIHIHHIKPLNEIGEEYIIDYKKDLIPVCPNCHAMLHRTINGEYPTVEELRNKIEG